ncbi:MAG: bifunctional nuclease family protein [Tannerella sp.]|jgi:bifunctional DNase/RNase|nr:bifunctional nuclease family protein [Tannerella sp.]
MEDKKIKLKVFGLANSQIQSGAYALVLTEESGQRRLPVIVGMFEAQSIAIALENIATQRPLTHDLFVAFAQSAGYTIDELQIYHFEEGVFYSKIVMSNAEQILHVDSRTSDGVAIALRVGCEIHTTEEIMLQCSVIIDEALLKNDEPSDDINLEDLKDMAKVKEKLKSLKKKDIENRINKAVEREDYEFAKILKDELIRRETE